MHGYHSPIINEYLIFTPRSQVHEATVRVITSLPGPSFSRSLSLRERYFWFNASRHASCVSHVIYNSSEQNKVQLCSWYGFSYIFNIKRPEQKWPVCGLFFSLYISPENKLLPKRFAHKARKFEWNSTKKIDRKKSHHVKNNKYSTNASSPCIISILILYTC